MSNTTLTYNQAINNMVNGNGDRDANLSVIHADVAALCKTDINPEGETSLHDWLCSGDWNTIQTADEIAAEWDALSAGELESK